MKKTKLLLVLSAMILGCMVVNNGDASNVNVVSAATANDVSCCNSTTVETNAVTIDYSGSKTPIYGIQAYAGMNNAAWIMGDVAPVVEQGAGSHIIGSNHGEGRNGLTFTFSVNSSVSGNAYLGLYGRFNDFSNATYTVNGGEASSVNLKVYEWHLAVPTLLPVTLVEGSNTITVTMGDDYTAWFESFYISNTNEWLKDDNGHNDTWFFDGNIQERAPVKVNYTGDVSKVYGIQSYAGIKGPAWAVGEVAPILEDGSHSHALGSNVGDGRSGLEISFSINSSVAANVNLNVYSEFYDNGPTATNATLDVNGTTSDINFFELNNNLSSAKTNATKIPVTLVEGDNLIKIKMQDSYGIWFCSWSLTPSDVVILPKHDQISIASWTNKQGYIAADQWAIGGNFMDDPANHNKSGSVDYVFTCETAGDYYLKLNAMAGAAVANRVKLTVNDVVYQENGNDYISLPTDAGWSYAPVTYKITLKEGTNVLTFANELAPSIWNQNNGWTNVPAGTEGSAGISNWYINALSLERVPNEELVLDVTDCKTLYNINRAFNSEGLKVYHKVDDETTLLTSDMYTVDSSRYVSTMFGSYEIVVNMKNSALSSSYYVTVGDTGTEFEGQTINYDGGYTGATTYSFYNNAKIEGEGTGECEGRIFWYSTSFLLADGGYQFGSNGAGANENRQMTLTVTINSSVEGTYLFKAYVLANDRNNSTLNIKVNDEEAYDASLFYSSVELPYMFEVDLKEGINTVTFKTYNQYQFWWNYLELAPIEYKEVGTTLNANQGVRWGQDLIDADANDVWAKNSNERSLTYYYSFENEGSYLVNLNTTCSTNQTATIYVDDTAYETTVVNGVTSVPVEVTAGNHTIKVYASGENSEFSMSSIQVTKNISPVEILVDTSNTNLTIPYDGIFDSTTITAKLKYSDDSTVDLLTTEFKVVKDPTFDETKPGTYVFKVVYVDNEEIYATFNVVVEEEVVEDLPSETPSVEPSDEPVVEPSDEPTTSEPGSSTQEPAKKGCKGGLTSSLFGLLAAAGLLMILKRNKK